MLQSGGMRRSWNSLTWAGFAVTLVAAISYVPIFVRFPATRDVPWVNLLLFLVGGGMSLAGLKRAYGESERYSGKVSGVVLGVLALTLFGLFCWVNFVFARRVPSSSAARDSGIRYAIFSSNADFLRSKHRSSTPLRAEQTRGRSLRTTMRSTSTFHSVFRLNFH